MAEGEPYQYLVLHQSCKNLPGVLACQAAHAAAESIRSAPVPSNTNVVALVAETSKDLEDLAEALSKEGIHHVLIHEPDPPYNGAATAVGVEPTLERAKVKRLTAKFRLLL